MADDDVAVLLQTAISEMQASRRQAEALMRQNQQLVDQNNQLTDKMKELVATKQRKQASKVQVSVQTKNLIHSVYRNFSIDGETEQHQWKFDERFESPFNKGVTREILREIQTDLPNAKDEEIICGCRVYFKSLNDDKKRRTSGAYNQHRIKQKKNGRLKHKLKIRNLGLDTAASEHKWSAVHKQRVRKLLTTDYMSSESSDEDDTNAESIGRSVLKVKKLIWLKKKYRNAFHQIDTVYYNNNKKSKDKLKHRIPGPDSTRQLPLDAPMFAIKSEYRQSDPGLNSSITSTQETEQELNTSVSSANVSIDSSSE